MLLLVAACRDATNEPVRSSLSIYGGNNQLGFDTLSNLGSPLAVLVTEDNRAIAGVRVQWKVVVGDGELTIFPTGSPLADDATTTDVNGIASVYFRPRSLGTNTVTASVSGATPVEFHAITNPTLRPPDVLITAGPVFDCTGGLDPTKYWLGSNARDTLLSASVGQRVGIRYAPYLLPACTAQFKSSAVPVGGTPFDSGIIHPGDTFEFKPNAAGKWTFVDAINGGAGTLTVTP
jgi:hypothetical protein